MEKGIMICGLNGSGKSTLGSALAESLGYFFIDNEDLFFPKTDPNYLFASPRSREEAIRLLAEAVQAHPNFVFPPYAGIMGRLFPSCIAASSGWRYPKKFGCKECSADPMRSSVHVCSRGETCTCRNPLSLPWSPTGLSNMWRSG